MLGVSITSSCDTHCSINLLLTASLQLRKADSQNEQTLFTGLCILDRIIEGDIVHMS
jgi:hypothetical protein